MYFLQVHEEHLRGGRGTATATSYACQTRRRENYYKGIRHTAV